MVRPVFTGTEIVFSESHAVVVQAKPETVIAELSRATGT
jgi:hypothetical protein